MAEDQFDRFMHRMDEIWAHKEAVASSVLSDIRDTTLKRIEELRIELNKNLDVMSEAVEQTITQATKDIRADMDKVHMEMQYKHQDHERRLSFTEKMVFGAAALILISVITALLAQII